MLDYVNSGVEKASKIITATSESKLNIQSRFGISPDRISVIPLGFDRNLFKPKPRDKEEVLNALGIREKNIQKLVVYTGRMTHEKGIDYLISAAGNILKHRSDIHFILAGNGGDLNDFKTEVKRAKLDKHIHFIGHRTPQDIERLNNIADINVLPSLKELFGISVLEALGTGTPVIATEVGGLKKIIKDPLGILVPPKNSKALTNAILCMLDTHHKEKYGSQISEFIHNSYSWEQTGSKLISQLYIAAEINPDSNTGQEK